jgi:hypothetical protein
MTTLIETVTPCVNPMLKPSAQSNIPCVRPERSNCDLFDFDAPCLGAAGVCDRRKFVRTFDVSAAQV